MRSFWAAVLGATVALLPLAQASAQDGSLEAPPAAGEPASTEPEGAVAFVLEGGRAPFSGFLIEGEDLARWRFRIETLEYRLDADARAAAARVEVLLEAERARTHAAEERLTLRETLWTARVEELAATLAEARRAAERQWYESEALWFAVGAVVAVAAVIGVGAALN